MENDLLTLQGKDPSGNVPEGGSVTEQTLRGEVEKIIFEKEDSSFVILFLKDAQGARHCVCGPLCGVYAGQGLEVRGKWEMHKEFGRRLKVTDYTCTLPSTAEGITKYLSSGVIKGIGEKYAEMIVKTFGAETLEVLDHASVRLNEVPGLGKKRIAAIREAWTGNRDKRELQIYMQGLGISPAYFARIYSLYGNGAAEVLRTDPYQLAAKVDGIGFILADRIAAKTGIGKNDDKRLIAGVKYGLDQIRTAGHVCMPRADFVRTLAELLDVTFPDAERAVTLAEHEEKALTYRSAEGEEMIYEPGLFRCEKELPLLIARLMNVPRHIGMHLKKFQTPPGSLFSGEQLCGVNSVSDSAVSIITGGPGVGKTTVVSEIVRRASLAKLAVALAAPTGRAAKRMAEATREKAYTLHRLLKWDAVHKRFIHGKQNPLPYDLFVLDETSMLDLPLSVAFFRAVKPGSTVVLVGDADQLPSVGPGNVLNDLISSELIPVSRLTKIFRQGEGSHIIVSAHEVNAGIIPQVIQKPPLPMAEKEVLSDFYWIGKEEAEDAADVIVRMITDRIPKRFGYDPMTGIQLLTPMNRGVCGTVAMNAVLQEKLNPSRIAFKQGERTFRAGDRVMQISNNYDKGVFNGDMGRITSIRHGENSFTVSFDGLNVNYSFSEADELTLAYAITVHKSQGSEFPVVVMPILTQHYMMLQRNLLYTGMTRAKKLMILVGSKKALSMAVRNAVREPRFSLLPEFLRAALGNRTGL